MKIDYKDGGEVGGEDGGEDGGEVGGEDGTSCQGGGGLAQPLTQPFTNHGLKMHFKTFQAFFANIAN